MKGYKSYINLFFFSIAFLSVNFLSAQNFDFKHILNALDENNHRKVDSLLNSVNSSNLNKLDRATFFFYFADYYFRVDKFDLAYESILLSKKGYLNLGRKKDVIDCNILILKILSYADIKINTDDIIRETEEFALKNDDLVALRTVYRRIGANYIYAEKGEQAIIFFKKIITIAIELNDSIRIGYSYDNISFSYDYTSPPQPDSSLYYNELAEYYFLKFKDPNALAYNYNNRGQIYKNKKEYNKAIKYLLKADSVPTFNNTITDKILFYENIAPCYNSIYDYKNEAKYLRLLNKLKDSVNNVAQNISITEIKEKYGNEKLRADNFKKSTLLTGSVLFILILTGYSYQSRKKQILANKEKELETQKNLTLLKEQEITTINAMVEGQEKERKRVAEDLHDNLGSVIATLKMHFDNLRINREKKKINQESLYDKTENLIDEAYQKVRNMAHAKNAGVIANQGLLVAVKLMAEKISSANTLHIEVLDYGLEKPLENSLEITLFRIIQELTTNIIKHSQATHTTINISQDEDDIAILIEDNGVGMNTSQVDMKKGMGLHSIKTRVEHLEGSFTIDSTPSKGTTIIINIPT